MKKSVNQYTYHVARNELREQAIEFHLQRYMEVGFLKSGEKDTYQEDSIYFAAVYKEENKVVGVNRLILKPMDHLPTLKEFTIYELEREKLKQLEMYPYAEMSALTKAPNHDCTLGMLRMTLQYSLNNEIYYWFCSLDHRVHKYMKRMFNFPFIQIGKPKVYLGSNTIPCILDLKETAEVLKETRIKLHEYLYSPIPKEVIK